MANKNRVLIDCGDHIKSIKEDDYLNMSALSDKEKDLIKRAMVIMAQKIGKCIVISRRGKFRLLS